MGLWLVPWQKVSSPGMGAMQRQLHRSGKSRQVGARRLRVLFLDARAAMDMAPQVAVVLAAELGRDEVWQRQQVENFNTLARLYLPQDTARE